MFKKFFLPVLLLTHFAVAQQIALTNNPGKITGKIIDASNGEAMPFAAVTVWTKTGTDSSLVGGVQTDETGSFVIANLPLAPLMVRTSFVGYLPIDRTVTLSSDRAAVNLETISLLTDAKLLKEVKITGEKDALTMSTEKRVFNVAKNLTSIGGTAESLLRNVPSITLDENGNPSLRNMATTIYINGKPTQLTLAQIPANQIESVEVISNPSARYDASTSGGIVNLVLKKNRQPGYNGIATVSVGQNHRYDATANLDWREGRWNVTALYSLNATRNPLTGFVNRTNYAAGDNVPTSYFDQNTDIALNNHFQNGRLAIDYQANDRNLFTVGGTVAAGAYNSVSSQQYTYRSAAGNTTGSGSRDIDPQNNFTNLGASLDWKHSFARKKQELNFTGSLTRNRVSNAADWLTTSLDAAGNSQPTYPERDRIDGRIVGNQYLAQLDYTQPVGDSAKWEFGLRSFTYARDQQYLFKQLNESGREYTLLQDYSQNALITESVNAAYALYTSQLRNGIAIQAGLRLEQSFLHGLSRFDGSTFGYNYPSKTGQNIFQSFFPSFSATKELSKTSELALSLSRKVGRPNFRHVFVGIQANDRQNITIGNPAVRPEFVNTAELAYTLTKDKLQWFASLYYIYEDHTIKPFTQPSADDPSILVTTYLNVKADIQYGLDQSLKFDMGKNLTILASANTRSFAIQSDSASTQRWVYNAKLNLTYKLPADISAQLSGTRDSRGVNLQGYRRAVNAADFALRKGLWDNRGSIVFTVNDIFNSRRYYSIYDQPTVFQTSMSRRDVRYYKFTLQLPLGKPDATFRRSQRKLERPDVDFSN